MERKWLALAVAVVVSAVVAAVAFAIGSNGTGRSASPGLSTEGIRVEGHWKLVVKNPDGRIVLVRRFHNDPTSADQAISTILTRYYTPGYWWIELSSDTVNGPACLLSGSPAQCRIFDPADSGGVPDADNSFKTLVTSKTGTQDHITLTGSAFAQRNGDVNIVRTNLSVCSSTVAPATSCATFQFWPFTSRTLGSPVSLVTGQQILVTVTLTFT